MNCRINKMIFKIFNTLNISFINVSFKIPQFVSIKSNSSHSFLKNWGVVVKFKWF